MAAGRERAGRALPGAARPARSARRTTRSSRPRAAQPTAPGRSRPSSTRWTRPASGPSLAPATIPSTARTVWSVILLAQLGASIGEDERIGRACAYLLDHALAAGGQFSTTGAPSGTADCLQGNLCWALLELGCTDSRLEKAFDWLARSVTGEGIAPMEEKDAAVRYYAGKCGPTFACGSNNKLPCAWGGVKVMLALGRWPADRRTPVMQRAIEHGVAFLLGTDPARAEYPNGWAEKPSGNWWKFGFPVFYVTDLLQNVEALVGLGYGRDPRLAAALDLIRGKQDAAGPLGAGVRLHRQDLGGLRAEEAAQPVGHDARPAGVEGGRVRAKEVSRCCRTGIR